MPTVAEPKNLVDLKRRLSARLLADQDVTGVGIRGEQIVVYLARDNEGVRRRAGAVAKDVAGGVPLVFEVTGQIRKQ